jgi:SPW repeat
MEVISSRTHTYIGLVVGALLVIAPWIFGFADEGAPKWVPILVAASRPPRLLVHLPRQRQLRSQAPKPPGWLPRLKTTVQRATVAETG